MNLVTDFNDRGIQSCVKSMCSVRFSFGAFFFFWLVFVLVLRQVQVKRFNFRILSSSSSIVIPGNSAVSRNLVFSDPKKSVSGWTKLWAWDTGPTVPFT